MKSHRAVIVILLLILSACATSTKAPLSAFTRVEEKVEGLTKHFEESAFAIGASRLCSVEVLLTKGTISVGRNDFDIIIHDTRDADVAGAELTVVARHMDGGTEASPTRVTADARIHGLYTATNLAIPDPGHWEMSVEVRMNDQVDTAHFDFPDVR